MIELEKNVRKDINVLGDFYSSVDNELSPSKTYVALERDDKYLKVFFNCENNYFTKSNNYTRNNDTLYKQEVFEMFIAKGNDDPIDYLEIEINPNNALFFAKINNPSGEGGCSKTIEMLDSYLMFLNHKVRLNCDSWQGEFSVPLSLIDEFSQDKKSTCYRFNFYRIRLKKNQNDLSWRCNLGNSDFLCFRSNFALNKPNFHIVRTMARLLFV